MRKLTDYLKMKKSLIFLAVLLLIFLFSLPNQGKKIQANANEDTYELFDPPKVEEKTKAVPSGLSTDSDIVKRISAIFHPLEMTDAAFLNQSIISDIVPSIYGEGRNCLRRICEMIILPKTSLTAVFFKNPCSQLDKETKGTNISQIKLEDAKMKGDLKILLSESRKRQ